MVPVRRGHAGSSPLARGTLLPMIPIIGFGGLIPARAGNTGESSPHPTPGRAHPRSRGEHQQGCLRCGELRGSSPLARGTRRALLKSVSSPGLIPARAGNTARQEEQGTHSRAHPRSRGEHVSGASALSLSVGSSPLARGTPNKPRISACAIGLIPARAGNTEIAI